MKKCKQCAEDIQDDAKICRFCGAGQNMLAAGKAGRRSIGCLALAGAAVVGWMLLNYSGTTETARTDVVPYTVGAADLLGEFSANEAAAVERYRDHPLIVTGTILSIGSTGSGAALLQVGVPGQATGAGVKLAMDQKDFANSLVVGQTVTLACARADSILGFPQLFGCSPGTPAG